MLLLLLDESADVTARQQQQSGVEGEKELECSTHTQVQELETRKLEMRTGNARAASLALYFIL